jgi:hypothetical protein
MHLETPDPGAQSAVAALGAVLSAAGRPIRYHDLAGATGLAFLFTWLDGHHGGRHRGVGREIALGASAGPLRVILRPFHPRGVDGGASCGTFHEHFRDSYAPLMAGALEHGQPLLCQGGWGGDPHAWGVLTRRDDDGQFGGWTVGSDDGPVLLPQTPTTADAVEQVLDAPPRDQLLESGLRLAAGWRRDPLLLGANLLLGSAALAEWSAELNGKTPFAEADDPAAAHREVAAGLKADRVSAYEFIYRQADAADSPDLRELCQRLEMSLSEQLEQIEPLTTAASPEPDHRRTIDELANLERQIEQGMDEAFG